MKNKLGSALRALRLALGRDGFRSEHIAQAFALVGVTSSRLLGVRPFDTQLIAGAHRARQPAGGDGDRRRQDAGRGAGGRHGRARRHSGARHHRQRLSGDAGCRAAGAALRRAGSLGRCRDAAAGRRPAARCVCLRHHLLHRQGTGLRLPARWPAPHPRSVALAPRAARGRKRRAARAARPVHGDHRRGGQHSDRRGAGAADPVASGRTTASAANISRSRSTSRARCAPARTSGSTTPRSPRSSPTRGASGSNTMRHRCRRCGATACIARKRSAPRLRRCTCTGATATIWCAKARSRSSTRRRGASPPAARGRAACIS